jgi:predicted dehydrogenase
MGRCGRHKKWHIIWRLSPGRNPQIKVGDKAETIEIPYKELYIGEVEDLVDAVLERKEPRMSLANSRDIIDIIVRLFESARTGEAITL